MTVFLAATRLSTLAYFLGQSDTLTSFPALQSKSHPLQRT